MSVAGDTSEDDDFGLANLGRSPWFTGHEVLVVLINDHLLPLSSLPLRNVEASEVNKFDGVGRVRLLAGCQTVENEHKLVCNSAHGSVASTSLHVVERHPGVRGNLIQLRSISALVSTDMSLTTSCDYKLVIQESDRRTESGSLHGSHFGEVQIFIELVSRFHDYVLDQSSNDINLA